MISTYRDALIYVSRYFGRWESDYQRLIQALTSAKGLGSQNRKEEVQDFFCPVPPKNKFPDPPKVKLEDLIF